MKYIRSIVDSRSQFIGTVSADLLGFAQAHAQAKPNRSFLGLLPLLLFILIILSHSHLLSQSSLLDNYTRPHLWEEIYLIPTNGVQPIPTAGDIHIDNGTVVFDDCGENSDKRVYRKIGTPLDNSWVLDIDFTPTDGGPQGVAHVIAGITAGTEHPYNIVPEMVNANYPTYTHTDQDGIFLEYLSPISGPDNSFYLRVRAKHGMAYSIPVHCGLIAPNGTTQYLRLIRNSSTSLTFQRYSDDARQNQEEDISIIIPSGITGLNVIQHSNIPQGSYNRRLSATVDNLRFYDSSLPCVRCEDYSLALSDQNYITTKSMRVPAQSAAEVNALSNSHDASIAVAYFDGLGRPLQEIAVDAAPYGHGDLISYHQYDAFGRETRVDLPYVSSATDGSLRDDGSGLPSSFQQSFYNSSNFPHIPSADRNKAFAETVFEASPLNRVIEQGAPGEDWQVGNPTNNLHTIRNSSRPNTTADDVFFFGTDPQPSSSSGYHTVYAAGTLMRQKTTDEHGIRTWTYTDKLGRIILEQREKSGIDARTYYLYDRWGRVKYVLPPQGTDEFQSNNYGGNDMLTQALLNDFAFQYVYDERGRVIQKRVPGADWVYLVYDPLDRVVLTQDGNQRLNHEWSFTKYDVLSRPILTGIFSNSVNTLTHAHLQSLAHNQYTVWHEVRDGTNLATQHGYSDQAFPSESFTGNELDIQSVTFYDDYDFDRDGSPDPDFAYLADTDYFPNHVPTSQTEGMVTGVKVAILDPDPDMPEWLWTASHYDEYGREIQTRADNHLDGSDITWYEYDFAGQMLFSKHEHIGHGRGMNYGAYIRSATIYKSYTYDPQGRLIRTEQKMEDPRNTGQETEFITLSEQRYDKLGQMSKKKLHYKSGLQFLQLGDYEYNIRGWMTAFNDPSTSTPSGPYRDLFSMKLHYNTGASSIVSSTDDLFNGNISAMQWQTLGRGNEIRAYTFSYDQMNRLLDAKYREKTGSNWNVHTDRYSVEGITYDNNGNILTLQREGRDGMLASSFGTMDELNYTYAGNQLTRVSDVGHSTYLSGVEQFVDGNTSGDDYSYDVNGNMITDKNKGITTPIEYNHFNKPTRVYKGSDDLTYIYATDGTKLRQKASGASNKVTDYLGAFHYEDPDGSGSLPKEILFFSHEEGRVRKAGTELVYEMFLRDHLGNNRVMFFDDNEDGWVDPASEVLQADHFYPFGLRMSGIGTVGTPAVPNYYLFTGKETQNEFGIGWIDFGARMYDASVARWNGVDALAEKYLAWSPYNYVMGNPVVFVDPDGNSLESTVVDRTGVVLDHKSDGDFTIYQVDNVAAWLAGGKKREGLEMVGIENFSHSYRVGERIDVGNRDHNMLAPQNGAIEVDHSIEGLIIPLPFYLRYLKVGLRWIYSGGKWVAVKIYKVGGRYFAKLLKRLGKGAAKSSIQLTKTRFGHTFINHGEDATTFLINRAKGSGQVQGQFLNNQKAAQFILDNLQKTANGAVNIPIPQGFPARVIMPNGTFRIATHIRLVPGGSGVKTAYPIIPGL